MSMIEQSLVNVTMIVVCIPLYGFPVSALPFFRVPPLFYPERLRCSPFSVFRSVL